MKAASGGTTGAVESLWGRIKQNEMGNRMGREKPAIGTLPNQRAAVPIKKKGLLEAAGELCGARYRPRTKETSLAWEFLLAFVASRIGAEERDVLAAATEECLIILKDESVEGRELERKARLEATLQLPLNVDDFAQIVNLAKRITDYVSGSGSGPPTATQDQDEGVVAVVFEDEDDEGGVGTVFAEEDGEGGEDEDLDNLPVSIPILKTQEAFTAVEEDYGELPQASPDQPEHHQALEDIDLESLAFPQGKKITVCPPLSSTFLF